MAHPTSLPGRHGIGDIGEEAFRFVDWLALARQRLWQVMPLGPTGYGNSPYASPSAFAGNPLLISLPWLAVDGLLLGEHLEHHPSFPEHEVDFGLVESFKMDLLHRAFNRFRSGAATALRPAFQAFCEAEAEWLDDYALFMALRDAHGRSVWTDWPEDIRDRSPAAMDDWRRHLSAEIRFHQFTQFQFRRQWSELRRYANQRDIKIIGDIPIFVAHDSVDVWAHREWFRLDDHGAPTVVAGVPPDAFTALGQRWGNPHYDWKAIGASGYAWWMARVRSVLSLVDIIRIDHFRGFAASWVVPAGDESAAGGRWERGPGESIFRTFRDGLGDSPFIVEDLGLITPDVNLLRNQLGLPGMKVLQFAFGSGPENAYLPHNYDANCAVYSGTHDNQTTIGWFYTRDERERQDVQRYIGSDGSDIAWDFIRLALASVADLAIVTLQDIMRLGDEARMNTPGRVFGNWGWRFLSHQLHPGLAAGLGELTTMYGRWEIRADGGHDPFDYSVPGTDHPLFG